MGRRQAGPHGAITGMVAVSFLVVLIGTLTGCSTQPYGSSDPYDPRYDPRYPGYPRPVYREYGPWDVPQPGHPGPPTWYGCPQQSASCYPD